VFTGIVQAIGRIASATPHGDGLRIAIPTRRVLTAPADPLDRILAPPVGEPDRAEVFTQEVAGRRGWNLPAG